MSTTTSRSIDQGTTFREVQVTTLLLDTVLPFRLFANVGGEHLLYRRGDMPFTTRQRDALISSDYDVVSIHTDEIDRYWSYLRDNIRTLLYDPTDNEIEATTRFYDASTKIANQLVHLPMNDETVDTARDLVSESLRFQSDKSRLHGLMTNMQEQPSIYTHVLNVCQYGLALGRQIGLEAHNVDALGIGLLLMDIGMLQIPDQLLFKSGPLSFEEWDVIKRHPAASMEKLQGIPTIPIIAKQVVFSHHERLDGTGYPQGLSGDEISVPVRVAAIADVFGSLTSSRQYRPAFSTFEALRIMHTDMRDGLDMELLREFIGLLGREERES